jgi:hypothetical protein
MVIYTFWLMMNKNNKKVEGLLEVDEPNDTRRTGLIATRSGNSPKDDQLARQPITHDHTGGSRARRVKRRMS